MKYFYRESNLNHVIEVADEEASVYLEPVQEGDEPWVETSEEAFIKSRAAEDGVSIPEETMIADEAAEAQEMGGEHEEVTE